MVLTHEPEQLIGLIVLFSFIIFSLLLIHPSTHTHTLAREHAHEHAER